jgi:hypothetical protein
MLFFDKLTVLSNVIDAVLTYNPELLCVGDTLIGVGGAPTVYLKILLSVIGTELKLKRSLTMPDSASKWY